MVERHNEAQSGACSPWFYVHNEARLSPLFMIIPVPRGSNPTIIRPNPAIMLRKVLFFTLRNILLF